MTIETTPEQIDCCIKCGVMEDSMWWVDDLMCERCRLEGQSIVHKVEYKGHYWKMYTDDEKNVYQVTCYGPTMVWGCTYPDFLLVFDVLQAELHDIEKKLFNLDKANASSKKFLTNLVKQLKTKLENDRRTRAKKG